MSPRGMPFGDDPERTRELARKGGLASQAALRARREPYARPFLEFLDATGRSGPTRAVWCVFWKAADGLPLDDAELAVFQRHTGRTRAPTTPAAECWVAAGRRAGKSENMVTRATWRAISFDRSPLAPGEVATLPLIARDRAQARNTLAYLRGLAAHAVVAPYVVRVFKEAVDFRTGVRIEVHTANYRAVRGYSMIDAIAEECAFWASDDSLNADEEVVGALRPALLTVPGARLYGISSPWARRGILWQAYEAHWGKDDSDVLVFVADTASLNPTVDTRKIARAFDQDAAKAASEYGSEGVVQFRSDVESFLSLEAVTAVEVPGRLELPPRGDVAYVGAVDPSGGSRDAFTLAIAHAEGERAVLDCVREVRPPFSPDAVCADYAGALKSYHLSEVTGDHYAGQWPVERFAAHGITYRQGAEAKGIVYGQLLPLVNAGRVELLELPRLRAQLLALERRTARGGRDSIDHPPGGHDDVANAVALAVTLVAGRAQQVTELEIPALYRTDEGPRLTREVRDPPYAGGLT